VRGFAKSSARALRETRPRAIARRAFGASARRSLRRTRRISQRALALDRGFARRATIGGSDHGDVRTSEGTLRGGGETSGLSRLQSGLKNRTLAPGACPAAAPTTTGSTAAARDPHPQIRRVVATATAAADTMPKRRRIPMQRGSAGEMRRASPLAEDELRPAPRIAGATRTPATPPSARSRAAGR
jgi:hypothetical protein